MLMKAVFATHSKAFLTLGAGATVVTINRDCKPASPRSCFLSLGPDRQASLLCPCLRVFAGSVPSPENTLPQVFPCLWHTWSSCTLRLLFKCYLLRKIPLAIFTLYYHQKFPKSLPCLFCLYYLTTYFCSFLCLWIY